MKKINLDEPFFYDLPPEEKSDEELTMLIMRNASGESFIIKKYSENEINRCVRKLIELGLIRGTVLGRDFCSWSRLTIKGRMYMKLKKSFETNANVELS